MLHDITFVLWYFLPAALANAIPIPIAKIPELRQLDAPLDFHKRFRGKPVFGPHKTWRGLIAGILTATATFWLQQLAARHFTWAHNLTIGYHYASLPTLIVGPLFAIGALGGDAIKSFFKRQVGKRSGGTWFPFDQLDYIVGGALLTSIYLRLTLAQYVWLVVIWFGVHLLISYLSFRVGIKDEPI